MKKFILPLIISLAFISIPSAPAEAGFIGAYKAQISKNRDYKNTQEEIRNVFKKQDKYTNNHDIEKLSELYADNFSNNDGYGKEVYFELIKDTWNSFPEISYDTYIRGVQIDGDYAAVQTLETAIATTHEQAESYDAYGELRSYAHSIYYLQRFGKNWLIVSEQVLNEKSQLKYGDARFIEMDLDTPQMVKAGDEYSVILRIIMADNEGAIASIGNQLIKQPLDKPEDVFRNLLGASELERLFRANKKNINEYATASIGIVKTESDDETKVYASGVAFLMTRVNVIPENKFIKAEDKNAQKAK